MQSAFVNLGFAVFFAFLPLLYWASTNWVLCKTKYIRWTSILSHKRCRWHSVNGQRCRLGHFTLRWPIVFALLLQVADNIAEKTAALALVNQSLGFLDKLTIAAQGSVMMAGFGLGVGLPFFIISVVEFKKLPKAGYWMNKIKYTFGFMIMYFAYLYLERVWVYWVSNLRLQ